MTSIIGGKSEVYADGASQKTSKSSICWPRGPSMLTLWTWWPWAIQIVSVSPFHYCNLFISPQRPAIFDGHRHPLCEAQSLSSFHSCSTHSRRRTGRFQTFSSPWPGVLPWTWGPFSLPPGVWDETLWVPVKLTGQQTAEAINGSD